ncbi:MAG: hypothetical protein WC612_06540 [Bdellovibrionales bacterium]|jgi:hypothetical protein
MTLELDEVAFKNLCLMDTSPTQFAISVFQEGSEMIPQEELGEPEFFNPVSAVEYLSEIMEIKETWDNVCGGERTNAQEAYDFILDHRLAMMEKIQEDEAVKPLLHMMDSLTELIEKGEASVYFSEKRFQKIGFQDGFDELRSVVDEKLSCIDRACDSIVRDLKKEKGFVLDKKDPRLLLLATIHKPVAAALSYSNLARRTIIKRSVKSSETLTAG